MKIDEFRTEQHNDLIRVDAGYFKDEIVITTIGSDSDDDDMHCYVRLNTADLFRLMSALLRTHIHITEQRRGEEFEKILSQIMEG